MAREITTLPCWRIGRWLKSGTQVSICEDGLAWRRRDGRVTTFSLNTCTEFATFQRGIFSGTLRLTYGQEIIKIKWLAKQNAKPFVDRINAVIGETIANAVAELNAEFERQVEVCYPRDSWLNDLTARCHELRQRYRRQRKVWHHCLSPEVLAQAQKILACTPFDKNTLQRHHEKLQLEARKEFFDTLEAHPLTEEQRLAVLRNNDLNLVLAAAGTGKTAVIVAKAVDLIARQLAKPAQIVIMAYNKDAAQEVQTRLQEKIRNQGLPRQSLPHVSTFHALGRWILEQSGLSTRVHHFAEDASKRHRWISQWLDEYLKVEANMWDFLGLFPTEANPWDFNDDAAYQRYVRDTELRTLQGEKVRSYGELQIANFLFKNGIAYQYEKAYTPKKRVEIGYDYRPDFYLTDADIYIEHFGIDRDGGTMPGIDAGEYTAQMQQKRDLHDEYATTLVETFYYEQQDRKLLINLERKLRAHKIPFNPRSPLEIFDALREQGLIKETSELFAKALEAIRVERLDKSALRRRFERAKIPHPQRLANLFETLRRDYAAELENAESIDFDDMIIKATVAVQEGAFVPAWTYLLVDEFQDISNARMELVRALLAQGDTPSLTVVGDDWQSVYRFAGGKLELTTRFGEMVGAHSLTKLQKTFRYNNSIADTAGLFVMENPAQYGKRIVTHAQVDAPQVHLLDNQIAEGTAEYGRSADEKRLAEVVQKIQENDPQGSIAVIARYNNTLQKSSDYLASRGLKQRNINFWTYHRSKGRESDYAVLLDFSHGVWGFPNANHGEAIVEALLPSLDDFPHSEERRLLYVGITRAKKKAYLIADPTAPSAFITELLDPKYKVDIASDKFRARYRSLFKCPNCVDGFLRKVRGKFGEWYACSSGLGCRVRPPHARVCDECGMPSIDRRRESVCNNPDCGHRLKICPECGRVMKIRDGKYGKFWGCSGFWIKDEQCTHKEKYED